ncbi:MAG: ABC transporter ATP-binding protein/permease [Proteobacteria bacterium]|nr:ABC transporter ATP-binding protein/permease [Pseudomonadota bacterium]
MDSKDGNRRIPFTQLRDLLLPAFRRYRLRILGGLAALIIVDFLQLIIPRFIKQGVDALEALTVTPSGLLRLAGIIVLIAVFVVFLRFTWRYLIIGFSRLLEQMVRNQIFAHILKMDAQFFEKRTTGDLMAHSSNDLSAVQMACGMGVVAAVDALVMSLAAIGFMIAIHPLLTLLALLPMPFLAFTTRVLSAKLHKRFATVQEEFSELTEFSRSNLISIGLIKAYTMEAFQTDRFDRLGKRYVRSNLRVAVIQGLITPLATLVGSTGMLMVLYFGGCLVIEKTITLGDFVAFITYLYMLIWPMMAIGWVANLVQRGLTSLDRIYGLVTSQSTLPDPIFEKEPERFAQPGFRLTDLTFTYPSGKSPVLHNLTLNLDPGMHGVTGRTGSGKSTLCQLLVRLQPLADGMLLFGGMEVNHLPLAFTRSHIGYVSQEPILFSDTIAANISFGRPDAGREDIIRAAASAAIHDDIMTLKEGYDTLIGERGVKLSGGQRQRLALARALLCNRPVLIIDDGLSAVDVATEHEVFAGLKRHFHGKTVVIVSNRIKLLSMTDHIIVLADGTVQSEGNHEHLLATNSLYQSMFTKQMQQDSQEEVVLP